MIWVVISVYQISKLRHKNKNCLWALSLLLVQRITIQFFPSLSPSLLPPPHLTIQCQKSALYSFLNNNFSYFHWHCFSVSQVIQHVWIIQSAEFQKKNYLRPRMGFIGQCKKPMTWLSQCGLTGLTLRKIYTHQFKNIAKNETNLKNNVAVMFGSISIYGRVNVHKASRRVWVGVGGKCLAPWRMIQI